MHNDPSNIHPQLAPFAKMFPRFSYSRWNLRFFQWMMRLIPPSRVPPYAVPARRAHLSGLPPAWIGVGTLDLFHDESLAYARRLQEHGVACQTHVVPGAFHGSDVFNPGLPIVQDFRGSQLSALRKYLG